MRQDAGFFKKEPLPSSESTDIDFFEKLESVACQMAEEVSEAGTVEFHEAEGRILRLLYRGAFLWINHENSIR